MIPTTTIEQEWTYLLTEQGQSKLVEALHDYLPKCRWFQSKAREVQRIHIFDSVPMDNMPSQLAFIEVEYTGGSNEIYLLPVKFVSGDAGRSIVETFPVAAIMDLRCQQSGELVHGTLVDAIYDERFRRGIFNVIAEQSHMPGDGGSLNADTTTAFGDLNAPELANQSRLLGKEQSNTSVKYGDVLVLKLMRKLEEGVNPELEIGRFLTEETAITHVPLLAGYIEYRQQRHAPTTVAVLQAFVQNQGDAWEFTLDWLNQWFQSGILDQAQPEIPEDSLVTLALRGIPVNARHHIGEYLDKAYLLGQRTAELHVALASGVSEKFSPVDFSMAYQRDLYVSIARMSDRIFAMLRDRLSSLPEAVIALGQAVLDNENEIREVFRSLEEQDIPGKRIRGHGDYHLGQVLYCNGDFVIVDFEGEPARPLPERYVKHSPLRDVAGMLRSFHYAAYATLPGFGLETVVTPHQLAVAEPWVRYWRNWVSVAFLQGYLQHVTPAQVTPPNMADFDLLLRNLIMEKAIYELGYEINNRPGWLKVPAQAITRNVQ